jgi:FkbM family methyltransferase
MLNLAFPACHMKYALDSRIGKAFPLLGTVEWKSPREADGFLFNVLGGRTRQSYIPYRWFEETSRILANEEMFEWVTIVETVSSADDHYTMADLGAGHGRWLVNAALLARHFGRSSLVIGVEAEDTHFAWMKQHLADNSISSAEQRLFHAPIAGKRQDVPFTIGHARDWYGQAIIASPDAGFGNWPDAHVEMRHSIVLEDILGDIPVVDLLDLDIQGIEAEVISSSIDLIAERVKRLHIGTHSREIENTLRKLMTSAGWRPRFDYPGGTLGYPTPAGPIDFGDGVQSWINPKFA